jgi:D-alanyl-D-alanine carboxypeptidase (penicillin-binding protein 5/6)
LVVTTTDGEQVTPLVAAEAVDEAGFLARAWIGLKQLLGMA